MLLNYQQKQRALNETDQKSENIFLIHGLFGSLSNLAGLAKQLNEQHNVILVDLRNHGQSPQSSEHHYGCMAEDIFTLADHLNIDSFSIVGHSMGGKVAMTCALQQPKRINKLVVADIAPVDYEDKHSEVFKGLQLVANSEFKNRQQADEILSQHVHIPAVRQFLLKSLYKQQDGWHFHFNIKYLVDNYQNIRGWPETQSVFDKETLFIKGALSEYIISDYQTQIMHLFPKAKAKVINDTGHWLHAEKPKLFNRLVTQFFN